MAWARLLRDPRTRRHGLRAAAVLMTALAGCVETRQEEGPFVVTPPRTAGSAPQPSGPPGQPLPGGSTARKIDRYLRLGLEPLGSTPYDSFNLPLASPDGRHLAVQLDSNADWPTILAEPAATRSLRGRIRLLHLRDRGAPELGPLLEGPYLLGRQATAEGFLLERVNADGSRDIGEVAWEDGSLRWLVTDGAVNAFAAKGPRGELAYSRRERDALQFDLVVERPEGKVTFSTGRGQSWPSTSQAIAPI